MSNEIPTIPGTPFGGGFYVGHITTSEGIFALIVAPKAEGEHEDIRWNNTFKHIDGALNYGDGLANTNAMIEVGSELAKWARDLRIGGFDDWYLPSQDELELCYRHFKPGTEKNWLYARSGINLSALPPTFPYTVDLPAQTEVADFKAGGAQAFDDVWYWSSTQHAGDSDFAWAQDFDGGDQVNYRKDNQLRARAVRRIKL